MVELLAPIGSLDAFYAAIENKADAIYLGGKQFGARAYANNFELEQLVEMIKYAHFFDVKVYVTVNTIIFDKEIDELIEFLDFLYLNDVDAVIVQDLGVLNIIRHRYPDFEIHASTQMNVHSVSEAKVLKDLGVSRIVVAREIDIDQIKKIKREVDIEIEAFIHGAHCVSSSGNCYISSIIGGRSGNRGRCAQPCRLPYSINEKTGYLISPKDLYSLPRIKELIEAGVDSLKIEGRMKRPEYVAQITKSYRAAINHYYYGEEFDLELEEENLRKIFNRGFTKGYLFNNTDEEYINTEASNHQGILIGKVLSSKYNTVEIELTSELVQGDSIRLVGNVTDAITVNQMYLNNKMVTEAKAGDVVILRSHMDGLDDAEVFLTTSINQIKGLEKSYLERNRKLHIEGVIDLIGNRLRVSLKYKDYEYEKLSDFLVEAAKKTPTNNRIVEQFNRTNNTVFVFDSIILNVYKDIFVNIKDLNELRRSALNEFSEIISKKHQSRNIIKKEYSFIDINEETVKTKVKVRNLSQLQVALEYNIDEIYVDDKSLLKYIGKDLKAYYVEPRVLLDEENISNKRVVSKLGYYSKDNTSIYMNTTNALGVNILENLGANSIGLSLEMSIDQIEKLVKNYKNLFNRNPNLEVMVYGRYELMMLKYKLGLSSEDLDGRTSLVDRKNFMFPLLLEDDYIKVLNSKKVHLVDYLEQLESLNISRIIDFTIESADEVRAVLDIYINKDDKKLYDVTIGHIKEGVL